MDARRQELIAAYQPVAPVAVPGCEAPSAQEREEHMLTHLPPKRWCEVCCMAAPDDAPHTRVTFDERDRKPPLLWCDFLFAKTTPEDNL
eukprot:9370061-Lingulodinium_polyedra.AAC.1